MNIQGRAKGEASVRQRPVVQAAHNQRHHVHPDVELLCLSLRTFYLPREFGNFLICSIYVPPPSANAARAATLIANYEYKQLERTHEAPVFILGDFNHCKLEFSLPGFSQRQDAGQMLWEYTRYIHS